MAALPDGYDGEFGPGLKAQIINLYHDLKMTELNIQKFLKSAGVSIRLKTKTRFTKKKKQLSKRGFFP
jgi:hypothetical protein